MRGKTIFFMLVIIIFLTGCAKPAEKLFEEQDSMQGVSGMAKGKNVLMIIAPENFRDEELFDTKSVLEAAGAAVTIASKGVSEAKGALGGKASVDKDIEDVNVADYDAVVFVGGPGAAVYFDDETVLSIAKASAEQGKVTAAICIAPSILANAGVLDGRKATCFSSEKGNLEEKGADYTGDDVTVDGLIITANGPRAAKKFGQEIAKALG